jgi:hypothetical protein
VYELEELASHRQNCVGILKKILKVIILPKGSWLRLLTLKRKNFQRWAETHFLQAKSYLLENCFPMNALYHILNISSPFEFQASKNIKTSFFQGDIILCGLYLYLFVIPTLQGSSSFFFQKSEFFLKVTYSVVNVSVQPKLGYPVLDTGLVRPLSLDFSKDYWICPVILPDLSSLL